MSADLGSAGLLRVAAVPAGLVAETGNPALFDRLRDRLRSEADYVAFASRLAQRLSDEFVPRPELPAPMRHLAVATRRALRRGRPVEAVDCRRLAVVNAVLDGPDGLTGDLLRAVAWASDLRAEDRRLDAAVERERARLATLPWQLVSGSPAAMRAVADAAPALPGEIRERLDRDPGWTGKRMRQRGDYLLRILARASGKTTPRGWLGHVASAAAGPGRPDALLVDVRVTDFAVHTVANIGEHRRALAEGPELPDAWLSMTGVHRVDEERLSCWVADPANPAGARLVGVRRTQPVDVVPGCWAAARCGRPTWSTCSPRPATSGSARSSVPSCTTWCASASCRPPSGRRPGSRAGRPRRPPSPSAGIASSTSTGAPRGTSAARPWTGCPT